MNLIRSLLVSLMFFTYSMCSEKADIIIIGAGPSGIAAAVKLLENGFDDILVLEAESRIGGRVYTLNFDGRNIDMGAEWCHGEKGNIVYETLKEKNILNLLEHEDEAEQLYLSSRQNISDEFADEIFDCMYGISQDTENVTEAHLGVYVENAYNECINTKFQKDAEKLKISKQAIDFLEYLILSGESALDWNDVSTYENYEDAEGDQNLGWKEYGYGKYLEVLTKKYPNPKEQVPIDDKILLNKEVKTITIGEDSVEILCSDRSSYKATHVIFTPSLGVLKEEADHLFVPQLPEKKIKAIKNIGFGAVSKVFLKYDEKWWGNLSGFNFVWTAEDKLASKKKFPDGPTTSDGESWIIAHFQIYVMPKSNILSVWYTGEMVPLIETMDETILKNGISYTLDLFLGHIFKIPEIKKMLRTTWYNNPHFRGTYSYTSVNSTGEDTLDLQMPLTASKGQPIVLFAGEATNVLHHSTVHGAVESGFREAERLIKLYPN